MTQTTASFEATTIQRLVNEVKQLKQERRQQNETIQQLTEEAKHFRQLAKFYYNIIDEMEQDIQQQINSII